MYVIMLSGERTCVDRLREIIFEFPGQTEVELAGFFPDLQAEYIHHSIDILIRMKHILAVESNGITMYIPFTLSPIPNEVYNDRKSIVPVLDFLRLMINSTDQNGYLINEVPYCARGDYPCDLYFFCNSSLYEVYYLTRENIEECSHLIHAKDESGNRQEAPANPRIVIVNEEALVNMVRIKGTKFIALTTGEDFRVFRTSSNQAEDQ